MQEINSFYSVLKRMEMLTVNVEELNYLAKRLDSFDTGEAAQFQAMAHKLGLSTCKDFINLTFCCQQATVITDFSDLSAVGRNHYMNLHGGSAKTDELKALDGEAVARSLIAGGSGTITPYGVVYDNGMKLEQVYDGQFFPCYYYEPNAITIAVTAKSEPEDTEHITWLYLPMAQLLDMEQESLADLNALAKAARPLSNDDIIKLGAAVAMARPQSAEEIKMLAESLDLFDFVPGVHTPTEYGKYMIQESERFEYDENLEAFYDYEGYALQRMNAEDGMFTDRGYIAYKGGVALKKVIKDSQGEQPAPEPWRGENRDEMLRMTLYAKNKAGYSLVLPADEEYLSAAKSHLGVGDFAEAVIRDVRFKVPYIGELICDTDCPSVEEYNKFAKAMEDIWQKDGALLTYAAVLDAERPDTLGRAYELLQNLENYERIVEGTYGYGQQRLQETLGLDDEAIYKLEGYMDFEKYGEECMEADGVVTTEFGLLRRLEPPFPEQRQGQRMM
ncbi:MAG: antirestriction protein ArdA [Firmicutes bacterium]|nr:antirestriction protein ArdA [Bacillota bacterium]